MKTLVTTICAVLAVLLVIAAPSSAGLISVGDTIAGDSWSQQFNESGVGPFDLVAVKMLSMGDTFETATHSGFSDGSWALLYEDTPPYPTIASASGSSTNSLNWYIQFAGDSSNPLNFDFVAFNGETIVEKVNADWSGSGWSFEAGTWSPERSEVVPEPGTLTLLSLAGLCGLAMAWIRRRQSSG